jgi:hypothetical protein
MNKSCPVCKKSGLPDYRLEQTICPQCDTDLSPYFFIHSADPIVPKRSKTGLLLALTLFFVAVVFGSLFFLKRREFKNMVAQKTAENIIVSDSLDRVNSRIAIPGGRKESVEADSFPSEITFVYKIRKGDYPGKVAAFFYNDWRMYKKIESDNHLIRPYPFIVGQELIIKLATNQWKH